MHNQTALSMKRNINRQNFNCTYGEISNKPSERWRKRNRSLAIKNCRKIYSKVFNSMLIDKAACEFLEGQIDIEIVAEKLYFEDMQYFSKSFTKRYKKTPEQFINMYCKD